MRRQIKSDKEGQELKTLTPDQMLSRLPVALAQLIVGKQKNLK